MQPGSQLPLAAMPLAELRDLQKELVKAIATLEVRRKAEARNTLETLAHELGYTFDEMAAVEGSTLERAPSTTIYRHPENPTITWSGRGRKPAWHTYQINAGGKPEDLLG